MDRTIKIEYRDVDQAVADMRRLAGSMTQRKLTVSFSRAQGDFVTQILGLADSIQKCGEAMTDIVERTADVLGTVTPEFRAAEEKASSQYRK